MGPAGCPETSVSSNHQTLHNSPEERSSRVISRQAEFVLNVKGILSATDLVTLFSVLWVSWPVELVEVTVFWRQLLLAPTPKMDTLLQKVSNSFCFDMQSDMEEQYNSNKSPTRCNNFPVYLSWRLFTAQHVSGVVPPIIKSSMTAVAASGFTSLS